jgi:muramidase (phage lysozyme)
VFGVVVKAPNNPDLLGQRNVRITDFAQHPDISVKFRNNEPNISTAAGRYQFLFRTWQGFGLPDFSPESQDIAAVILLKRRGAIQPLLDCDLPGAVSNAIGEWASLPASPYGQPTRAMTDFSNIYQDALTKCREAQQPCSCHL